MDADVKLVAANIDAPKLPLEKMSAHLLLDGRVLKLKPLNFDAAGGRITSNVTLDAREASIQTTPLRRFMRWTGQAVSDSEDHP
jgi:uncharacterized protein involved in outer membrane biogenesis